MNIKRIGLIGGGVVGGNNSIDVVNDLTTGGTNKALSAEQGKVLNSTKQNTLTGDEFKTVNGSSIWGSGNIVITGGEGASVEIVNDLTTGGADKALSAEMGKVLGEEATYVGGSGTIPLCFAYVGWRSEYKEITVQKFNGISDTSIILYLWDGESKTTIILQYADAIVDGLKYTWKTDQYTIIVDFGRHSSVDVIQTSKKSAFLFKDKCFLKQDYSEKIEEVQRNIDNITLARKEEGKYITIDGTVNQTTSSDFYLTSYIYAEAGVRITNARPVPSALYSYIHFFDSNFNHLSYISDTVATVTEHILTSDDIPANAKYIRVELRESGNVYAKRLFDLNDIAPLPLGVPYDYATALTMDKNVLRSAVEIASAGKCTVLYDNDGYPSLMYKIPIISIGALENSLGDFNTPHPAFIVGGVQKTEIYISVFQTCVYNGHYVSWFWLSPTSSLGIKELRQNITAKGDGWHLETIYERSLLGLLTRKYNSPTPRGNTSWGRSSIAGYEYESVQMSNGNLPGQGNQINGARWINGTQPHTWSHDKTAWGIQDVIGGYHEICDLVKMVDGFLYMPNDNNYSADESTWLNTGVAIDVVGKNIFSTTITSTISEGDSYVASSFNDVQCSDSYDTLPEQIRKKMTLLLLAPRLLSSDTDTVLGINGYIQSRPAGVGYIVMGGAEEYANSGLGYYNIAYDLSTVHAHNNMGSRLAYIK